MNEIEGNTTQILLASFARSAVILLTGASTLIGVLGEHSVDAIVLYLQSNSFIVFGTSVVGTATWVYGLWKQRKRNEAAKTAGVIAQAVAPDKVMVKGTAPVDAAALAAKLKETSR